MTFTFDLWEFLSLIGFGLGLLLGLGRLLLVQFEKRLDARFALLEDHRATATERWRANFAAMEAATHQNEQRLTQLLVDLPLYYQRREDAIRQEVGIIHRLDALAGKVDSILRCDAHACPLRLSQEPDRHDRSAV
jgi:hypothetical protein